MISLLCPTRGRATNVSRLVRSVVSTASDVNNIELVFRVDEDDDLTGVLQYKLRQFPTWPNTHIVWGRRGNLSDMWNECWRVARGPVFMLCADDLVFRTPGWDEIVLEKFEEFPDRIAHVFGDDLAVNPNDNFGTHGFLHENWCDAVGHFVPPDFPCDFVDSWLNTVAQELGRNCRVPIITEHLHQSVGKAAVDSTHTFRRRQFALANKLWERSGDGISTDVSQLRQAMTRLQER